MNIAFVCSSLEPGRDGVGDYTRRLTGELTRRGHSALAVAANDPYAFGPGFGTQQIEGQSISVLRLPSSVSWKQRARASQKGLEDFQPDWLSLQFVPFGFHRKGLCFQLAQFLGVLEKQASWHVMFHELWLGLGERASLKHRVLGTVQRLIVLDLMRTLRPRVVQTQAEPYRVVLGRHNINASILPLFSNIPNVGVDGWDGLLEPLITRSYGMHLDRSEVYLAGVLGMVAPEWRADLAVTTLLPLVQKSGKRLALVFFGKSDVTEETANRLKWILNNRIEVVALQERSSAEMSRILQTLDIGIATTPRQVIQKSGATAAMLEHGLKVLVPRDDWRLRGPDSPPSDRHPQLLSPDEFAVLRGLPKRDPRPPGESGVKRVTSLLLSALAPRSGSPRNSAVASAVLQS